MTRQEDTARDVQAQTKKLARGKRAADHRNWRPEKEQDARRRRPSRRSQIQKLLSRHLGQSEVDFLLAVWSAGRIRAAECRTLVKNMVHRGWLERDGKEVRLTEGTLLVIAEDVE
jgi:hypothetical protein